MTDKTYDEKAARGETDPEKTRRQEDDEVEGHAVHSSPEMPTRLQEDQEAGDDGGEGRAS